MKKLDYILLGIIAIGIVILTISLIFNIGISLDISAILIFIPTIVIAIRNTIKSYKDRKNIIN